MKKHRQPITSITALALISILVAGCASIKTAIQKELEKQDQSDVPANTADAIDYASLNYTVGGFHAPNAALDTPRISHLSVKQNGLSFRYDVDLSSWGLSHTDYRGALACLFCRVDGRWIGGKFDWISSSRTTRDFKNIHGNYNGWHSAYLADADAYAFVIVHVGTARRSNVILQEGKK